MTGWCFRGVSLPGLPGIAAYPLKFAPLNLIAGSTKAFFTQLLEEEESFFQGVKLRNGF